MAMTNITSLSGYLERGFDPHRIHEQASELLESHDFDTVVATGVSGTIALPMVAFAHNVNMLVVRKSQENCHSWLDCEGVLGSKWMFVDDFIHTGDTFRRVHDAVTRLAQKYERETEFVGAYLYAEFDGGTEAGKLVGKDRIFTKVGWGSKIAPKPESTPSSSYASAGSIIW